MPSIKSITNALKGKARKLTTPEKLSTTSSNAKDDGLKTYSPMYDRVDLVPSYYASYLKAIYTDITFEDLTTTVNLLYKQNYSTQQVAYSVTSLCRFSKD